MPIRSPGGAGYAPGLGVGLTASGCAGGPSGVGLTAAFAVGPAFLGDARRRGAFFADFFLIVLVFLTVLAFLRVAALVTGVFLRFAQPPGTLTGHDGCAWAARAGRRDLVSRFSRRNLALPVTRLPMFDRWQTSRPALPHPRAPPVASWLQLAGGLG